MTEIVTPLPYFVTTQYQCSQKERINLLTRDRECIIKIPAIIVMKRVQNML